MSDQTDTGAPAVPEAPSTGAPEATPEAAPSIDFGPLAERFDGIEQRLEQMMTPPEPEPEVADNYAGLGELGYSEEETAATRDVLQKILSGEVQQAVGPLQEKLQRLQSELDYGDLEAQYPVLATQEGGEKVMAESRQYAVDIGRQLGLSPEQAQQLALSPRLMELAHLASVGKERAAQETPAGQPGAELEQPGGASPPEPEPDVNDSILGVSQPGDVWGRSYS